jgi:hypothetical protein
MELFWHQNALFIKNVWTCFLFQHSVTFFSKGFVISELDDLGLNLSRASDFLSPTKYPDQLWGPSILFIGYREALALGIKTLGLEAGPLSFT